MWMISVAIVKLAFIVALGFIFYKRKIIDQRVLAFLTFLVVNVAVPCLFFSHLIENAPKVLNAHLWMFLGLSLIFFFVGVVIALMFSSKAGNLKREFISVVSLQNSGYLPMNIAYIMLTGVLRQEFLVYTFLNILGFNILMWSVGTFFLFRKKDEPFRSSSLFTPPIFATVVALILIYSKLYLRLPEIIITPVKMIGEISFVLSMIILGCWLAKISIGATTTRANVVFKAACLKLLIVPAVFTFIVLKLGLVSLLGFFIVLQSAMPSAVSLPIVLNMRGAHSEFASEVVFLTHLFSILTIPLWLGIYMSFSGFKLL